MVSVLPGLLDKVVRFYYLTMDRLALQRDARNATEIVITNLRKAVSTTICVDQVDAPGVEGDFGVLPDHAPFMTALREGVVTVYNGGIKTQYDVHGGFADVNGEGLTILAEEASELVAN